MPYNNCAYQNKLIENINKINIDFSLEYKADEIFTWPTEEEVYMSGPARGEAPVLTVVDKQELGKHFVSKKPASMLFYPVAVGKLKTNLFPFALHNTLAPSAPVAVLSNALAREDTGFIFDFKVPNSEVILGSGYDTNLSYVHRVATAVVGNITAWDNIGLTDYVEKGLFEVPYDANASRSNATFTDKLIAMYPNLSLSGIFAYNVYRDSRLLPTGLGDAVYPNEFKYFYKGMMTYDLTVGYSNLLEKLNPSAFLPRQFGMAYKTESDQDRTLYVVFYIMVRNGNYQSTIGSDSLTLAPIPAGTRLAIFKGATIKLYYKENGDTLYESPEFTL